MKKTLSILILAIALSACSDKNKKDDNKETTLGKYVYIDIDGVLHTENPCVMGLKVEDENKNATFKSVMRIKVEELDSEFLSCAFCVTDEQYELLKKAIKKNKKAN